jgi:6-phosphogluconolactonase
MDGYDLSMAPGPTVRIVEDAAALAVEAAALVIEHARAAVALRGRFTLALSGGATPRATYERLAEPPERDRMPWDRTWMFFGDERCVPPDHPESNYLMASETLLSKVPVPTSQVFRMRGESEDPEAAATEYARTLATVFGTRRGEMPRFDLILLGFGVDGHTASLFPGSPALKEVFRSVAAVHAAAAAIPQRLTLTYPVLNAAACVAFLGSGAEKAKVVKAMLGERAALPAAMVQPTDGTLLWILDRGAAHLLSLDAPA